MDKQPIYTPAGLELLQIYHWIDRHKPGGFDQKLSYTQNLDLLIDFLKTKKTPSQSNT